MFREQLLPTHACLQIQEFVPKKKQGFTYMELKSVAKDFCGEMERRWHQIHWSHEPTRQRDSRPAEFEENKAKERILTQEPLNL